MTTSIGIAADQAAFLAAIRAAPDDDTPRLVYADWLQENDGWAPCSNPRCQNGEVLGIVRRVDGVEMSGWNNCHICNPKGDATVEFAGMIQNNFAERAEFIRVQVELAGWQDLVDACPVGSASTDGHEIRELVVRGEALRRRERELLESLTFSGIFIAILRRGSIDEIVTDWEGWLAHHEAILSHPDVVLRRVELTTWPDNDWLIAATTREASRQGHVLDEAVLWFVTNDREASRTTAKMVLTREFPGHCEYEHKGQTRHHPIKWVLPGESTE